MCSVYYDMKAQEDLLGALDRVDQQEKQYLENKHDQRKMTYTHEDVKIKPIFL